MKRRAPKWFLEEPALTDHDRWLLRCFGELSTCRSFGMGEGPIPWTAIVEYAKRLELRPAFERQFVRIMRETDRGYLEERARADVKKRKQEEAERAQNAARAR